MPLEEGEGISESQVSFYNIAGHSHDGTNSTQIDFSAYNVLDIIDIGQLRDIIMGTVNNSTLSPNMLQVGFAEGTVRIDGAAPSTVTNLTASSSASTTSDGNSFIDASWVGSTNDSINRYVIELHKSETGVNGTYVITRSHETTALSHRFERIDTNAGDVGNIYYKVIVYAISPVGVYSVPATSSGIVPAVNTTPPANTTFNDDYAAFDEGVKPAFKGMFVYLDDNTEFDVKELRGKYEYQVSVNKTSFDTSANLKASGKSKSTYFLVNNLEVRASAGGSKIDYYLRVRAINSSGTASTWVYYKNTADGGASGAGTTTASAASAINVLEIDAGVDVQANTITANEIFAGTITATEIESATITGDELNSITINASRYIQSPDFVSGSAGWKIEGDGNAEFSEVTVRGVVYADTGRIGGTNGWTIASDIIQSIPSAANAVHLNSGGGGSSSIPYLRMGAKTAHDNANAGVWLDPTNGLVLGSGTTGAWLKPDGKFYLGGASGALQWDGSALLIDGGGVFTGTLSASVVLAGSIAIGFGNDIFKVENDGDMWVGHATQGSAPFQVYKDGSVIASNLTIIGLGSAGIDIGGTDATSWHMDADGNQWWGTSGTYGSAAYRIANWGGAYLLYARIGGAAESGTSETGKAWEINEGNITNVSTHNSIAATDGIAIGLNSVSGIFRAAGGKIIARGYPISGSNAALGDIRMGIARTTTDQPEYNTVGDIAMFWDNSPGTMYFSVEKALTVQGGDTNLVLGTLHDSSTTSNKLYRSGSTLYWNGSAVGGGVDWTADQGSTNIHSGNYTNTTYTSSDFNHDSLTGFVANEHIDWSVSQSANIHSNNYTNTTYSVGDGGLTTKDFTTTLKNKLDGIASSANNYTHPSLNHVPTGGSTGQFLEWTSSGLALWSNPPADATKLPLTGGTMSGGITFSGGNHITGSASSNVYFQGGSSGTSWLRAYSGSSAKIKCGSAGDIVFYASPRPSVSTGHDLGTSSLYWNYLYAKKIDYSAVGYAVSSGLYLALQSADDYIKLTGSSERIKKEIVPIPIADALTRIKALRPVDFSAKKNHSTLAIDNLWEYERFRGFIAEEVAAVSHQYGVYNWWESDDPESEDYDKPRSHISTVQTEWTDEDVAAYYDLAEAKPHMYSDQAILADAVAALQELSNKLDAAEARIAVLETA